MSEAVEFFEERAAVMEFDGKLPRIKAESLALRDVIAFLGQEAGKEAYGHMQARREAQ